MSVSPNGFKKKKLPFDFSDNAMMTSSVKVSNRSSQDQTFLTLTLQRELKKVKKSYDQLSHQYQRMKDWNNADMVDMDLKLQQSKHQITCLKQERQMLRARVKYLEKESTQMTKSYQKPLNRSTIKSGLKRSTLGDPDTSNLHKSSYSPLKTDRSLSSCTSLQNVSKNQKEFSEENFEFYDLSLAQVSSSAQNTVRFDKNWNDTQPLIEDENSIDECQGCGNQKCLKNYEQLQKLRESTSDFAKKIEDIFIKIQFQIQRKLNQKNYAEHKLKLQALYKQCSKHDQYYRKCPSLMIRKIEEKVRFFLKCKKYQNSNPLLGKIDEKMKKIKAEEEALREELIFQAYDDEEAQKKDIQLMLKHDKMFKNYERILKMKGVRNLKFEQLREKQKVFTKSELKKLGVQLTD